VQEPAFTDQFVGKKGPFAFGEGVEAVTGATVSSNAALDALNSLFAAEEAAEAPALEPLSASSQGFGGPVEVTITLNADGAIATLEVGGEGFAETPGIGTNVQEPAFTDQFVGKKGPFAFGEGVDAVAGATVSSNAALDALNSLFAAEEAAEAPAAEPLSASSQGFGGPVEVTITLNADGAIASLEVGGEGFAETPGLGTNVQEPAFTDQFVGKKGPFAFGEGVDAVAGATVSSNAALDALNSLFQ
ncbi:MAG: FMN-binding protein, partial [Clostridiales bacterium]|nr:FMN-binding protein [Clostridiales bacterium]